MTATKRQHFDWIRLNSRERSFQLRDGRKKVISLTWQNIRGTCATAEARSDRWLYTCIGYLSRQVIIQSSTTGKTVAIFKPAAGGGILRFIDGETYTLKSAHATKPEMVWENPDGETLVRFKGDFGFETKSGGVEVAEKLSSKVHHDTPLLVSLGWYLMVSSHLDMSLIM